MHTGLYARKTKHSLSLVSQENEAKKKIRDVKMRILSHEATKAFGFPVGM